MFAQPKKTVLFFLGTLALFIGFALYYFCYPEKNLYFKYHTPYKTCFHSKSSYSLASFLHVFSFSLISLSSHKKINNKIIIFWTVFWSLINSIFEILQNFSFFTNKHFIPDIIIAYFENGTFDWYDLIAIWLATFIIIIFSPLLRD